MRQDNILWEWANAHVFYNIFARKTREDDSLENQLELDWRRKVITESPNGKLLIDNSFFRDLSIRSFPTTSCSHNTQKTKTTHQTSKNFSSRRHITQQNRSSTTCNKTITIPRHLIKPNSTSN